MLDLLSRNSSKASSLRNLIARLWNVSLLDRDLKKETEGRRLPPLRLILGNPQWHRDTQIIRIMKDRVTCLFYQRNRETQSGFMLWTGQSPRFIRQEARWNLGPIWEKLIPTRTGFTLLKLSNQDSSLSHGLQGATKGADLLQIEASREECNFQAAEIFPVKR